MRTHTPAASRRPTTTRGLLDLLASERLLPPESLRRLRDSWHPDSPAGPHLAELVQAGLLTPFQADRLAAGRPDRLRLGSYRLTDRLGRGSSGVVYRAEHALLCRTVVLKVFPRGRVPAEVAVMGTLSHPHIVAAHHAETIRGRTVLVLEHTEGVDLAEMLRQTGPLPIPLARTVAVGVLRALEHLHRGGLVHGDVKPANILVGHDEAGRTTVKLIDLGLARRADEINEEPAGTVDYLAPERVVIGEPIDIRGDVYGLGATLYHLLTGEVAYPGGSDEEKLLRVRLDPAPCPLRLRPDLPAPLAMVVRRLISHDVEERPFPKEALENAGWYEGEVVVGELPSRRKRRPWPAGVALSAIVLGIAAGVGLRNLPSGQSVAVTPAVKVAEAFDLARALRDAKGVVEIPAGTHRLASTDLGGRSLTLRGSGPCVLIGDGSREMFYGEGELRLYGLTLRVEDAGSVSPLVQLTGGTLTAERCVIEHPGRATAISLRGGGELSLKDCVARSDGQIVAAESGGRGCRLNVERTTMTVPVAGVAVLCWRDEAGGDGEISFAMTASRVTGGRILACRGVGDVRLDWARSHLVFDRAMVSFAAYQGANSYRGVVRVRESGNTTIAGGGWVMIDGVEPAGAARDWSAVGVIAP